VRGLQPPRQALQRRPRVQGGIIGWARRHGGREGRTCHRDNPVRTAAATF
jgi:hypothetical protein